MKLEGHSEIWRAWYKLAQKRPSSRIPRGCNSKQKYKNPLLIPLQQTLEKGSHMDPWLQSVLRWHFRIPPKLFTMGSPLSPTEHSTPETPIHCWFSRFIPWTYVCKVRYPPRILWDIHKFRFGTPFRWFLRGRSLPPIPQTSRCIAGGRDSCRRGRRCCNTVLRHTRRRDSRRAWDSKFLCESRWSPCGRSDRRGIRSTHNPGQNWKHVEVPRDRREYRGRGGDNKNPGKGWVPLGYRILRHNNNGWGTAWCRRRMRSGGVRERGRHWRGRGGHHPFPRHRQLLRLDAFSGRYKSWVCYRISEVRRGWRICKRWVCNRRFHPFGIPICTDTLRWCTPKTPPRNPHQSGIFPSIFAAFCDSFVRPMKPNIPFLWDTRTCNPWGWDTHRRRRQSNPSPSNTLGPQKVSLPQFFRDFLESAGKGEVVPRESMNQVCVVLDSYRRSKNRSVPRSNSEGDRKWLRFPGSDKLMVCVWIPPEGDSLARGRFEVLNNCLYTNVF